MESTKKIRRTQVENPTWSDIEDAPEIFPPTPHGHDISSIEGLSAALDGKVDKVPGKGLSTEDYTSEDKGLVGGMTAALEGKVDKVPGKGLSTKDYTSEDKAYLAEIPGLLARKLPSLKPSNAFPATPEMGQWHFHTGYGLWFYYDRRPGRSGWYSAKTWDYVLASNSDTLAAGSWLNAMNFTTLFGIPQGDLEFKLTGISGSWSDTSAGVNAEVIGEVMVRSSTNTTPVDNYHEFSGMVGFVLTDLNGPLEGTVRVQFIALKEGTTEITIARPIVTLFTRMYKSA